MTDEILKQYEHIRGGGVAIYPQKRALISVHGGEAKQFLDGLITNDVKSLEDGSQMLAAFPNAQGRLIAVVRVLRNGERFLFETESATHKVLFDNLFRFTYAGDFFVEDLTDDHSYFDVFGTGIVGLDADDVVVFDSPFGQSVFIKNEKAGDFRGDLLESGAVEISDELFETLRIEAGVPLFGVDMDETTVVPELGIDGLISYNKGCYIGQEIIARIHFRGHVAKQLTGLVLQAETRPVGSVPLVGAELTSVEGKPAGRITSVTYSPKLQRHIALAFVRYDFLAEGTQLNFGNETAKVKKFHESGK